MKNILKTTHKEGELHNDHCETEERSSEVSVKLEDQDQHEISAETVAGGGEAVAKDQSEEGWVLGGCCRG